MGNDKSADPKKAKGEVKTVGWFTGPMVGFILIVIGAMVSFTGIGLLIGVPMILIGIAYPFIGRSLIKGPCPYCGQELSAFGFNPDFPLGDFSYFVESAVIAVAGTGVTCSNGNH